METMTQKLKTELNEIMKNPKNKNFTKPHDTLKDSFKLID